MAAASSSASASSAASATVDALPSLSLPPAALLACATDRQRDVVKRCISTTDALRRRARNPYQAITLSFDNIVSGATSYVTAMMSDAMGPLTREDALSLRQFVQTQQVRLREKMEEKQHRLTEVHQIQLLHDELFATFALPEVERATDLLPDLVALVGQFLSANFKPSEYVSIHALPKVHAHEGAAASSAAEAGSFSQPVAEAAFSSAAATGGGEVDGMDEKP